MLATVFAILVTIIYDRFTLPSDMNNPKMSPTSKFRHRFSQVSNSTKIINFREPKERFKVFLVVSVGNIDVDEKCWKRLYGYFGDNYDMVTVLFIKVIIINYLLTLPSDTNIPKMSPTSKFRHRFS